MVVFGIQKLRYEILISCCFISPWYKYLFNNKKNTEKEKKIPWFAYSKNIVANVDAYR